MQRGVIIPAVSETSESTIAMQCIVKAVLGRVADFGQDEPKLWQVLYVIYTLYSYGIDSVFSRKTTIVEIWTIWLNIQNM